MDAIADKVKKPCRYESRSEALLVYGRLVQAFQGPAAAAHRQRAEIILSTTNMLTLYHAPTTRSFRIKWLLNELGTPYAEQKLDFYGHDRHQPEYRKVNPMGSVPTMEDDGLVLTESGAIINYILARYGQGRFGVEPGSREAALVDEWMYWSEGLFAVHQRIYWDHCAPPPGCILEPIPSVGREGKRQALRYARMLEGALREDGFVVGDD